MQRGLDQQPASRAIADEAVRKYLTDNGWPTGLRNTLIAGLTSAPIRYFICDDSGSMVSSDGHRMVVMGTQAKIIACSRWTELTETLKFHLSTATIACAASEFRMLNGANPIMIGSSPQDDETSVPFLTAVLDDYPGGSTPLCHQVNEIVKQITAIAPSLRAACKKAVLVIFTDGEASDGDVAEALRPLNDLPVWVVIRLCTDAEDTVRYWNAIDNQLELRMDVLDDPIGESKEVLKHNPWLTYGTSLHRLREFGVTAREFDMIDETPLSAEQLHKICALLFGVKAQELPHPDVNWKGFRDQISSLNDKEPLIWSPETRAPAKWIDMKRLVEAYGPKGDDLHEGSDADPPKWATPPPASSAVSHTSNPIVPQWGNAYTLSGIYPVYEEPPVVMGGGHAYTLSGINPIYEPHTLTTTTPPIAVPVLTENPMNSQNAPGVHAHPTYHNTSTTHAPTVLKTATPDYSMMAGPSEKPLSNYSRLKGIKK